MADQSNNQTGGLMGSVDPDLIMNLGLGLMGAAAYGGNIGTSLQGAYQNYQQGKLRKTQIQQQGLQLQQMQQEMPMRMQYLQRLAAMNGQGQQPAQPQQTASGAQSTNNAALMGASASAPPPGQQPAGLGLMGLGAFGQALGMPGAQGLQEYGKAQMQYSPQVETAMGVGKDPLTIDRAMIDQARASGDATGEQAATFKYLKDSGQVTVDRFGNVVTMGGVDPKNLGVNTFLPQQGVQTTNGVMSNIPGAAPAKRQMAAAESVGRAAGETIELTDNNPDSPTFGQKFPVPKTAVVGGGVARPTASQSPAPSAAPASPSPGNPAPAAPQARPLASSLSPQQESYLKTRGVQAGDYLTEMQKEAEAARDTNYSIDQMLQAASGVQLGAGAPTRAWGEKWLSGLAQQVGLPPSKELTGYTELEKYANKIAFAATRQMGSREAAQIVNMQMASNPNKSMTPDAFYGVANSMKAMNNYLIDKNAYLQGTGQNSQGEGAKWTQQVDPRAWALTLSPEMGKQWAETIGRQNIEKAYQYMQPQEKQALLRNIPPELRKKWLTPGS